MQQFNYLEMHYGRSIYNATLHHAHHERLWRLQEEQRQRSVVERRAFMRKLRRKLTDLRSRLVDVVTTPRQC